MRWSLLIGEFMPGLAKPPSIYAHLLEHSETTHADVSNFEGIIDVIMTAVINTIDNMIITPDSLEWRFMAGEEVASMSAHLPYYGLFGMAFVGIIFSLSGAKKIVSEIHWAVIWNARKND